MNKYWFKPKRYGLGAAPSSWEGWALVVAYVAAIAALAYLTGSPLLAGSPGQTFPFIVMTVALTIVFVFICWLKTEGGWRWRWGDKD